jgi:hypothetical protein
MNYNFDNLIKMPDIPAITISHPEVESLEELISKTVDVINNQTIEIANQQKMIEQANKTASEARIYSIISIAVAVIACLISALK